LHTGTEVATVPDVRRGAYWTDTAMPVHLSPAVSEPEKLIDPPNVGRSTLLAALSLPHDMGDDRIRHLETFWFTTDLEVCMACELLDVFRESFRRQIPIIPVWAVIGEGLETLNADTYHLLGGVTAFWRRAV
jgi:hypothetical protein